MTNKIMIVGDVFFSKDDQLTFFDRITNDFKDCLILANLEGAIDFNSNTLADKSVHLSLPQFSKKEIPKNLIFSFVNNHSTDFGVENYKNNLQHFGEKILISSQNKISNDIGNKKFIFLADKKEQCILEGTNFLSFSNRQISQISSEIRSSTVIVHGGIEHRYYPTPYQRALARRIIELGADKIIFHHSHVIGHQEYWKGGLIHYGLGNAFFSDISDLHSLDQSISHGVMCDESTEVFQLDQLRPLGKVVNNDEHNVNKLSQAEYINFYKSQYRIDGSFRPRQLSSKEFWINSQFFFWSKVANFLVRKQLSKKIKNILNIFFNTKKKG